MTQPGNPAGNPNGNPNKGDRGPDFPETVSPQLKNRKHEIFARYVAGGETQANAYELAGYNPSSANASTLANRPEVAKRIAVLKKEKEERDLKFEIELRKANIDPNDPEGKSRQIAEWGVKQVLDLYYENVRLAQQAGQFKTAQESLDRIAKILCLLDPPSSNGKNDKSSGTQVGIAIYQDAVKQLEQGGGVSPSGSDNPLAPAV